MPVFDGIPGVIVGRRLRAKSKMDDADGLLDFPVVGFRTAASV